MSASVPLPSPDPAIDAVLRRALERIGREYPDARVILLKGSLVRGDAGPCSDIDLDVLVDRRDDSEYAAWFDEEGGRLHHVSVAIHDWEAWWDEAAEPAEWAMGLAALEVLQVLWSRDGDADAARRFTGPGIQHPAAGPELEDCFSDLGKVRNALLRNDDLGVRLAAQGVGRLAPTVLATLAPDYPSRPVTSHRAALDALLDLPVAPAGYRADLIRCLGLDGAASTPAEIASAAERLVLGTIALLEEHASLRDEDGPRFEIGLDTALANRTLRAYVHQIHLSTGN
ncbi:MAG: nucleotidyltransferase domain-containing protein [Thermomicrobiales bacterium]